MKLIKFSNLLGLGLLLTFTAVGCRTPHPKPTPLPSGTTGGTTGPGAGGKLGPGAGIGETAAGIPAGPGHPGWIPNASIFKAYTVHFDFDSSTVKGNEKRNVESVARELKNNPDWAVQIEGHCDERGTEEYNRSLGERRAQALREELAHLGIDPNRVDTISYGEDKPVAGGHDESAWKQNRRGEFIQLTAPK